MAIEIEKGVPIPPRITGGVYSSKYPWAEMEIGDSFLNREASKWFATTVSTMGRKYNRKFAYRVGEDGVRVWRIA